MMNQASRLVYDKEMQQNHDMTPTTLEGQQPTEMDGDSVRAGLMILGVSRPGRL
jgi:hypothetical protein